MAGPAAHKAAPAAGLTALHAKAVSDAWDAWGFPAPLTALLPSLRIWYVRTQLTPRRVHQGSAARVNKSASSQPAHAVHVRTADCWACVLGHCSERAVALASRSAA